MDLRALSVLGCVASSQKKDNEKYTKSNEKVNKVKIIPTFKLKQEYDKKNLIDKNDCTEESDGKTDAIVKQNTTMPLKSNDVSVVSQKVERKTDEVVDNSKDTVKKPDVKTAMEIALAKLQDTESTVEVVTANVKRKFVFKNFVKVVNGNKYLCKMGYNEQNVLFFNKCVLIGQGSTTAQPAPFNDDVAQFFEMS